MELLAHLRLLLANRDVAWLASSLPEPCVAASRYSWSNVFLGGGQIVADDRRWSRVVVFSRNDIAIVERLLVSGGAGILIELIDQHESRQDERTRQSDDAIETDDGYRLSLIVSRRSMVRNPALSGRPGQGQSSRPDRLFKLRRAFRVWLHSGWKKPGQIRNQVRDLEFLDRRMLPHRQFYLDQLGQNVFVDDVSWHYVVKGARLLIDPVPDFSTRNYLAANLDVAADGINPFLHYLYHGIAEGRRGARTFHVEQVSTVNCPPDIAALWRRPVIDDLTAHDANAASLLSGATALSHRGRFSAVIVHTAGADLRRTLTSPWLNAAAELLVVTPAVVPGLPDAVRQIVAVPGEDPATIGIRAASEDVFVVLCDNLLVTPATIDAFLRRIDRGAQLVTGRVASRQGALLDAGGGRLGPTGELPNQYIDALSPALFAHRICDRVVPHFFAGRKSAVPELVASANGTVSVSRESVVEYEPMAFAFSGNGAWPRDADVAIELSAKRPQKVLAIVLRDLAQPDGSNAAHAMAALLGAQTAGDRSRSIVVTSENTPPFAVLEWIGGHGIAWMALSDFRRVVANSRVDEVEIMVVDGADHQSGSIAWAGTKRDVTQLTLVQLAGKYRRSLILPHLALATMVGTGSDLICWLQESDPIDAMLDGVQALLEAGFANGAVRLVLAGPQASESRLRDRRLPDDTVHLSGSPDLFSLLGSAKAMLVAGSDDCPAALAARTQRIPVVAADRPAVQWAEQLTVVWNAPDRLS